VPSIRPLSSSSSSSSSSSKVLPYLPLRTIFRSESTLCSLNSVVNHFHATHDICRLIHWPFSTVFFMFVTSIHVRNISRSLSVVKADYSWLFNKRYARILEIHQHNNVYFIKINMERVK
jgi:hypothetical protein